MLYIFLVNTGKMMTFEMNLALDTVENLKTAIYEQHQIPVQNQVLLISGGESLNLNDRVCKYSSSGTDTSPIFLFNKTTEFALPVHTELEHDDDMQDRVESCLQMEPNFNTVVSRTEMAHQLYENDKLIYHKCDMLVHDQHYQQQGWAAVVANLDDIVKSFSNKATKVEQLYNDIQKNKSTYYELLDSFESDKQTLSRIPILQSLNGKSEPITLLDWILQKDTQNSLDELYCLDELNYFDQEKLDKLKADIEKTLQKCNNSEYKEIHGLENRLAALDKIMFDAKKVFDKQGILTKGLTQNHSRMSDLRDLSILPDLCHSHKEQLEMMLKQHNELLGIKSRVLMAKNELSLNLHKRLHWIVHIEEKLKEADDQLVIYGLKLKKLREKLEIIQNLHLSPQIYLNSIVEVLRRKSFSESFYKWSQSVSKMAREIIDAEVKQRNQFSKQLEKHFLKLFFPGMSDLPENFTTDIVPIDQSLPQISVDELNYLKAHLPDMSAHLVVPSTVPLPLATPMQEVHADSVDDEEPVDEAKPVADTEPMADADTSMLESLSPSLKDCSCSPISSFIAQPVECHDAAMATSMSVKDIDQLASAKVDLESCLEEKNLLIEDLVQQLAISKEKCQQKDAYIEKCTVLNAKMLDLTKSLRVDTLDQIRHEISRFSCKFKDDVQTANVALERLANLQGAVNEVVKNLEYSSTRDFAHSFISIPPTPDSPKSSKDIEAITAKYKIPKNIEMIAQNNEDKISVTSCEIGDNVLVYYEKTVENFIVFTLTGSLHYIHTDSIKDCDFGKDVQSNEFQWIIAKVLDKEYCQIKKEENRYKLPINKKFYRVKVKQISKCNASVIKDTTDQGNIVSRSYMPQANNRTLFGSLFGSIFGTSDPQNAQMPKSAFEPNN